MSFRFAVVGCGSIGKRHLRNLLALGERELWGVDLSPERQAEAATLGVRTAGRLEETDANVVLIALPNSLHLPVLREAVARRMALFVEKPLAVNTEGVAEVLRDAEGLVGFMGSNWKFHPSFQTMKRILEEQRIGRILSARAIAGQYLPDWHPWEDYRRGYSARKELGGGILLDSHEINYMTWLLGPATQVACMAEKLSDLEIDTEDTVGLLLRLQSGALLQIHLDYNQRTYQRAYDFHGTEGFLSWDMRQRAVRLYEKARDEWTVIEAPHGYDLNQMYLDQTAHFLACLRGEAQPMTPLQEGFEVLRIIEAAKKSSECQTFISL